MGFLFGSLGSVLSHSTIRIESNCPCLHGLLRISPQVLYVLLGLHHFPWTIECFKLCLLLAKFPVLQLIRWYYHFHRSNLCINQMEAALLQVISEAEVSGLFGKVLESGLLQGILLFACYILWKELKEERKKNDILTDKVITNNITTQEQLKDIIELVKSKNNGSVN